MLLFPGKYSKYIYCLFILVCLILFYCFDQNNIQMCYEKANCDGMTAEPSSDFYERTVFSISQQDYYVEKNFNQIKSTLKSAITIHQKTPQNIIVVANVKESPSLLSCLLIYAKYGAFYYSIFGVVAFAFGFSFWVSVWFHFF